MGQSATPLAALSGLRVLLVGQWAGMSRVQAARLLRSHGALPIPPPGDAADIVLVGEGASPREAIGELPPALQLAVQAGRTRIISETDLWRELGWLDAAGSPSQLYTPAMLAELVHVPLATIRRWQRLGWLEPVQRVRRLNYFGFREVALARQLAALVQAGASTASLARQLTDLQRIAGDNVQSCDLGQLPLAELDFVVHGRELLLRDEAGLRDAQGQLRLDFPGTGEAAEAAIVEMPLRSPQLDDPLDSARQTVIELLAQADDYEERGLLAEAIAAVRASLMAGGPAPERCFRLAELLYRQGDLSAARERYYAAIELDEEFVEARANLGCLLAELGDRPLAIEALRGALEYHPAYPDAQYHLARLLDEVGEWSAAAPHWRAFLELAPQGPWADEARRRLGDVASMS